MPRESAGASRPRAPRTVSQLIVVGIDGSASSLAAAEWALEEAHRCGATLEAVCVWESVTHSDAYPNAPFQAATEVGAREAAQAALDAIVTRIRRRPESAGVRIEPLLLEGLPGPALVDESRAADLLVIGTHGRRAWARMLLGSVSSYCVLHATCSTVVVPSRPVAEGSTEPARVPARAVPSALLMPAPGAGAATAQASGRRR